MKKHTVVNIKDLDYIYWLELCKNLLTNEPILHNTNFAHPFILTKDASNYVCHIVSR